MRTITANHRRDITGRRTTPPGIRVPRIPVAAVAFVGGLRNRYRRWPLRPAALRPVLGQTARTTTLVERHYGFLATLCPHVRVNLVAASPPGATAESALSGPSRPGGPVRRTARTAVVGAAPGPETRGRTGTGLDAAPVGHLPQSPRMTSASGHPTEPRALASVPGPVRSGTQRARTGPGADASLVTGIASAGLTRVRALRTRLSRNETPAMAQVPRAVRTTRPTPVTTELAQRDTRSTTLDRSPARTVQASAPGNGLPPADLRRVTQDVMRQIDGRLHAWRERTGRV